MRKIVIPFMAVLMFAGLATAVVGADCPPGQPCIMSGGNSSASADTFEPVEKSGPDYNASLEVSDMRPESNVSENVGNASYGASNSSYTTEFEGVLKANSACYRPDFEVSGSGDSYTVDVSAQKQGNKTCTQVITHIDYSFEFESSTPVTLEASQGNISETFEHPRSKGTGSEDGDGSETDDSNNGGVLSGFFNWLSGLF